LREGVILVKSSYTNNEDFSARGCVDDFLYYTFFRNKITKKYGLFPNK